MIRLLVLLWLACAGLAAAQEVPAELDADASRIANRWGGMEVTLTLSHPVPWRARLLADPPRLLMDFRELDFGDTPLRAGSKVRSVTAGKVRSGWSRMVVELDGPYTIRTAEMRTGEGAVLDVRLDSADEADFAAAAGLPEPKMWALPKAAATAPVEGSGPLLVMIDPGHGGIDPGATSGQTLEKTLTLAFANELRTALLRDGTFKVALTREDDSFLPLETRLTLAKEAGAGVFLSIHADALAEGEASGATIYTLSERGSDRAARALSERHDRDDLLAGVDLTQQDDVVAGVLMDLARTETEPRTEMMARAIEAAMQGSGIRMHPNGHQTANFSVLKAPDIPSALIELGFMSSAQDMMRLVDPQWRAQMAHAIVLGLKDWARRDAQIRPLLRR
nr:N-acetylmuramoyl-L-alanine amidase [Falsirhodobacter algicola]